MLNVHIWPEVFKLCVYEHCICKIGLSERDCNMCLETQLTIRISHPALMQKIEILDSRAVIRYVEHTRTTCSFQVTSLSTLTLEDNQ